MVITSPQIEEYLTELLPDRPEVIRRLEQEAADSNFPIVGPGVGVLLMMYAMLTNATRIFELGSGFGYSALWFLRGMNPDGRITLTDFKPKNLERAEENISQLGYEGRAEFLVGNALELLEQQMGPFDILFSDIDKEEYPKVVEMAEKKLRKGGLLITDNALWHGKVVEGEHDEPTRAVHAFNKLMNHHPGFITSIIPLRDGVSIAIKR